jgi:hypothetical protein
MGLQHAIHDVREDAAAEATAASAKGLAGLAGRMTGMARLLPGVMRCPRTGRQSIWRMLTMAILVYVVCLNLANFLVVRPVREKLDNLVDQKAVIEDFLLLRQSGQAVAGVRDALMRGDERVTVLGDVRNIAAEAGLRVVGEPDLLAPRDASKKMTEYPIEITLRGSYHDVGEFLRMIESSHRMLTVQKVEMDARDSSPTNAEVVVTLSAMAWED